MESLIGKPISVHSSQSNIITSLTQCLRIYFQTYTPNFYKYKIANFVILLLFKLFLVYFVYFPIGFARICLRLESENSDGGQRGHYEENTHLFTNYLLQIRLSQDKRKLFNSDVVREAQGGFGASNVFLCKSSHSVPQFSHIRLVSLWIP